MGIIKKIIVGDKGLTEKQEKIRKLFMYLVSGGITTIVNWVCYYLFDNLVKANMMVSAFGLEFSLKIAVNQIICWVISVLVAYFLNRITVFRSKGSVMRELLSFAGARVISFLVLEVGVYYLMIWGCEAITAQPHTAIMTTFSVLMWSVDFTYEYLVKLINSVFIVIANYVMSKLMVFKKKDMVDYNSEGERASEKDKEDA